MSDKEKLENDVKNLYLDFYQNFDVWRYTKCWQSTNEFRWFEREYHYEGVPPIKTQTLQQCWIEQRSGDREWRDILVVKEKK